MQVFTDELFRNALLTSMQAALITAVLSSAIGVAPDPASKVVELAW